MELILECNGLIFTLGYKMKESDLLDLLDKVKKIENLTNGNLQHWIYVLNNANSLWLKAPFQVGDLVMLNKTPEITVEKSWGWMGSRHYLIKGALARVHERSFYDGRFVFGLLFEDESYKDYNGKINPVKEKHVYSFGESWLSSADYGQLTCEAL